MADPIGFTPDFLAELQLPTSEANRMADDKELATLDFYQVAANSKEERDPRYVGPIENLLRTNDILGLEARLGKNRAAQVQERYNSAWRQVEQDRYLERSTPESIKDFGVGVGNSMAGTLMSAQAALASTPLGYLTIDPEFTLAHPKLTPEQLKDAWTAHVVRNNAEGQKLVFDAAYSDRVLNQRKFVGLLDAQDERDHSLEADATAAESRGEFLPTLGAWGKRVASDAGSGAVNTLTNPTMAVQGTADAVGSIIIAGGINSGLSTIGEKAVAVRTTQILEAQLAKGVERTAAQKLAEAGAEALRKKLLMAEAAVSTGTTEGVGALQEQASSVLNTSFDELTRTSEDFRKLVAEYDAAGVPFEQAEEMARNKLAITTGQIAGVSTGAMSAGIGALIPETVTSPLKPVRGVASDALREGVEEFGQGTTGQLIQNAINQAYVNPEQDILAGVGTAGGQGGILGVLSSGGLKAPGGALQTVANAGTSVATKVQERAEVKQAEIEAQSPSSVQGLTSRTADVFNNTNNSNSLSTALQESATSDAEANKTIAARLNDFTNSVITSLPGSISGLTDEQKSKFNDQMTRAESVDAAAKMLLAEKDDKKAVPLAQFFADLMAPVQANKDAQGLSALKNNEQASKVIEQYQGILQDINNMPSVKKAMLRMITAFQSGEQTVESIAAVAIVDPNLGGKVSSEQVQNVLAHATSGTLTDAQLTALKGSLALLKAREAQESLRELEASESLLARHLGGDRNTETTSRQTTVEMNPLSLNNGKFSARGFVDTIISSMVAGDTDSARIALSELGNFVQHFQNKVGALNQSSLQGGANVAYQQYTGNGNFQNSETNPKNYKHKTLFVNEKSEASLKQARQMDAEANLLYNLYTGLVEAYPELGGQAITKQTLALVPKVEPKRKTRFSEQVSQMTLRERASAVGTDSVTGLRTRQSWEESERSGQKVMIITSTAVKPINDDPNGGHDVTNNMLRAMGAAIARIDPNAARGGTNFILETNKSAQEVMDEVSKVLPEGIELAYGEGNTLEEAFQDENARTAEARKEGKLPERGQTAFDLKKLPDIKFSEEKAPERISQQTVDRVRQLSDQEFENSVLRDPEVPAVLSGAGWKAIPRKAFIASIDLKGLKKLNDLISKTFGNDYLRAFSEAGIKMGGEALDFAHLSGDEYAIQADTREELEQWMAKLEEYLNNNVQLVATNEKTGVTLEVVPAFRQGIGDTYGNADKELNTKKRAELAAQAERERQAAQEAENVSRGVREGTGEESGAVETDGPVSGGEVSTEEVKQETLAERFSKLFQLPGKVRNFFAVGLKNKAASTRTAGEAMPLVAIRKAISTQIAIRSFLGKDPRGSLTEEVVSAWSRFMGDSADNVGSAMTRSLKKFLATPYSEGGKTWGEMILSGEKEVTLMQRGKPINLVEQDDKGNLRYNSALLQSAVMAALQWHLSSDQRQPVQRNDEIAQELGYHSAEEVPGSLLTLLGTGQNMAQAKQSMASYIRRFWGVSSNSKAPMGFSEAIVEAMAAEALLALEAADLIEIQKTVVFYDKEGNLVYPYKGQDWKKDGLTPQTFERFITKTHDETLNSYPELLEEMVVIKPEFASFYGEDTPPVANRMLSNSNVALSKKARTALKNMQAQQFFLNMPMVEGILKLGEEGVIKLFGNPLSKDTKSNYNESHLESLESQNKSLRGAYKELTRLVAEMRGMAGTGDVAQLGKRYQYAINSVNRIMMLGAHNPQANKLMREMILPTWSTLNMADQTGLHYTYFMQAFAQAMGQKVHQNTLAENVAWSNEAINGKLAPVLGVLSSWLKTQDAFPIGEYQKAMEGTGIENSPLVAMALTEVARLQNTEDKTAFRTPLYLESDGMTNGPFNSMGLLATGEVIAADIQNWRRGGLNVGSDPKTADQLRKQVGKTDLYKQSMIGAQAHVNEQLRKVAKQDKGSKQVLGTATALFNAMSILLDGEVSWDSQKSEWQFERGLGKNPSTVLVYGAGNPGIANKLVARMTEAFYEKLSAMAKVGGTWDEAALEMFPKDEPAMAVYKAQRLRKAMDALAAHKVIHAKDGNFYAFNEAEQNISEQVDQSPQKFQFNKDDLSRMQNNMLNLLVNPMKEGIRETLGPSVFESGDLLVEVTNTQSVIAREVYLKAVQTALNNKIASLTKEYNGDEARAKREVASSFLSRDEMQEIWNNLKEVMPLVDVDGQRFLIAKNALLAAGGKHANEYSRSLDDGMRTSPYVEGIAAAGVNARPYLTIGMGDARMVRKVFENAIEGVMQVFDGINLRIDKIPEYGARINQAAAEAWTANIFEGVNKSFTAFIKHPAVKELIANKEIAERLMKEEEVNVGILGVLKRSLDEAQLHQEARNKAISKFATSWDQMSGTYAPYVKPGESLTGTDEQIAGAINEEIRKNVKAGETNYLKTAGTLHKTGVTVYDGETKTTYLSWLAGKLAKAERDILYDIFRAKKLDNVKIVLGNSTQVQEYQKAEGLSSSLVPLMGQGKIINGYYHPGENIIFLLNGNPETALHEIIHAGTYRTILAHYNGTKVQSAESIVALERLMEGFLSEELKYEGMLGTALQNARRAILDNQGTTPEARANMLNEFMAWNLSNRELIAEHNKVDGTLSKLARMTKNAFKALVKLITGKDTGYQDTFFNQVRFNSAMVARDTTLENAISNVTLAHATLVGVDSNRLTEVATRFGETVARYLTGVKVDDIAKAITDPLALAKEVTAQATATFPMSQQAQDTFHMMVLAMATEAKLNSAVMTEAQRLYQHFLKNVDINSFRTNEDPDDQNDIRNAREQYEFITGHSQNETDPSGRSTLLPVFMALATVNDNFRKLLATKTLPEKIQGKVVGMDSALEVAGQKVMDKLQERLIDDIKSNNVTEAIDSLTNTLIKSSQDNLLDLAEKIAPNNFIHSWNEKVSEMLDRTGNAAGAKGDALAQSKNPIARGVAVALQAVSLISSDENAATVSEEVLVQLDKHPGLANFFKDIVADMIGRIKSQAQVYDMIKRVRALVSQTRQAYREKVPSVIEGKFKVAPTTAQWDMLYTIMGRYDMATLFDGRNASDVLALASNPTALSQEINRMESEFGKDAQGQQYLKKIDQYVNYVKTGQHGRNLLRNANAISELLGEKPAKFTPPTGGTVAEIDTLITLKMLQSANPAQMESFQKMVETEPTAMEFMLNYLRGQRTTEMAKANQGMALFNHYKGMLPSEFRGRGHVVVVTDDQHSKMVNMGYKHMGAYKGSSIEAKGASKSYWYSSEGGVKTTFNQGIAQNVQNTAYGVRIEDGSSTDGTAGRITDPVYVKVLTERLPREKDGMENLLPIFNQDGAIMAFERTLSPEQTKVLRGEQHLAKMIGEWKGRQTEEAWSHKINKELLGYLGKMYQEDSNKDRYVNLLGDKLDPVVADAVAIMPRELKAEAESIFGEGKFMVRRNQLNSVIGYRNASIGDLWTGTSRWSPELQKNLRNAFMAIPGMGPEAYRKLVWAERNWQAAMASIRTNIVVRSLIVPAANFMSGVLQLSVRGISVAKTLRAVPKKVAELEYYSKSMSRKIELEAERFAEENNPNAIRRIDAELKGLDDSMKRLSIWPLIEAGEFSTISDVGQTAKDLGTGNDTLIEKLTQTIDKLPPGLRDAARQGYMARDTALFRTMQKATQYSDFVMKSIYFDFLKEDGQSTKAALAGITEEFNNYDVPPGRDRGYLESIGLAWFLNYKIRATKIGLSMIRNNPLNMLLYMVLPHPSSSGIPGTDNIINSLMEFSLGRSFGPGMAASPIALNPWYNLVGN